ncbi:MAG: hypothetical protein ACKVT1_12560 [Dehalococcoidia bacterium]
MRTDTLAYIAFGILFLTCTVVVLGFVMIAWLGITLGLLWMAAATPFVVFMLILLYRYRLGDAGGSGHGERPR